MKLSIIILNYKNKNLVKYFLQDVLKFRLPWEYEVVVVDNNSQDGIKEMIEKDFDQIKLVASPKNLGMGRGNNLGIQNSKGEYVLIANPDITLSQQAIEKLVEFLDKNQQVAIAAPKMLNPDKSHQHTCYHWPKPFTFLYRRTFLGKTQKGQKYLTKFLYNQNELNQDRQVDWVLGGCFMVRRKALDEVGLFDKRFFLFLEDTDLCRRMWQKRWEVWYVAQAQVIHLPHRLSSGSGTLKDIFSKLTWIHLSSWFKYFLKWHKADVRGLN